MIHIRKYDRILTCPFIGYVETQRGFHAKNKCDSRIYEYFLPSYTLQRQQDTRKWTDQPTTSRDVKILTEDGTLVKYMTPTDPKKLASFRVNPEKLNKFKEAMGMFQGTHNFHNYTVARSFQDRAAQRFMIDINVMFSQYLMVQSSHTSLGRRAKTNWWYGMD